MVKTKKEKSLLKPILLFIMVIIIGVIVYQTGLIRFISDIDAMQTYFEQLGLVGYMAYILLYILVAVLMIPASAVTIVAGITFGSVLGGVISLLGATIGATVAFVLAKYVARDMIVRKFGGNPIFQKIEEGCKENGVSFLILTRLVPVFPYNLQNYAYGITNINVGTFALVSLITMAPGSFIYAFIAGEIVTNGVSVILLIEFAVAGIVLFLVSLIPKYIAKKKGIEIR